MDKDIKIYNFCNFAPLTFFMNKPNSNSVIFLYFLFVLVFFLDLIEMLFVYKIDLDIF